MDRQVQIEIAQSVNSISTDIESKINSIVGPQLKELDGCMSGISKVLARTDFIPDADLEYYAVRLPELLYWASSALSSLELQCTVSKIKSKERYNLVFLDKGGTQGIKQAEAELAITDEKVVTLIYETAYDKLRRCIDMGTEMLQSVKKIMSKRMSEFDNSGKVVEEFANYRRSNG